MKNSDPRVYSNAQELTNLRLSLLAEKYGGMQKTEDGKYIAHDLLSI